MKEVLIDGRDVFTIADIHEILAEELGFPDYYGKNLDALYDCLTEISEEVSIGFRNADVLRERLGIAFERLCRVIADAAEENGRIELMHNAQCTMHNEE